MEACRGVPSAGRSEFGRSKSYAFVASCVALVSACENYTRLQVTVTSNRLIAPSCIERVPEHLVKFDSFAKLALHAGRYQQYSVRRRPARVTIGIDVNSPEAVDLRFSLLEPAPEEEKNASLGLLEEVRSVVMDACNLSEEWVRVTRQCVGSVCER